MADHEWEMRTCALLRQYFDDIHKQRHAMWMDQGRKGSFATFEGHALETEIEAVLDHWASSIPGQVVYGEGPYGQVANG